MMLRTEEPLAAPAGQAWALIGDFGGLRRWHPGVRGCTVHGSGIGALRTVELDGWHAVERLTAFDPARFTLGYEMVDCGQPLLIGVRGTMMIEPLAADRCRIVWDAQLPEDAPEDLEPLLRAYYPQRIGHLRDALARSK